MLPRKLLIPLRREFPRLRKTGRWLDFPSLRFLVSTMNQKLQTNNSLSRFAFIVPKKVFPLSMTRHQIKRRLANAVMALAGKIPKGADIVIFAKKTSVGKTTKELEKEIWEASPTIAKLLNG